MTKNKEEEGFYIPTKKLKLLEGGVALLQDDLAEVLFTEEEIAEKVAALGAQISAFYAEEGINEVVVVGVLRGASVFMSDLVRRISVPLVFDFIDAVSYGKNSVSSGAVRILKDLSEDIFGRHVLVVEDIVDTGATLQCLINLLRARKPESLRLCAFLNKPSRRQAVVEPDFYGFDIADDFVVGYGMDFAGRYRQLPYIAILNPAVYEPAT